MPFCHIPDGKEVTAKQAMEDHCHFVMKEKKDPYSTSIVKINRSPSPSPNSRRRKNRRSTRRMNRKNRRSTRRNRK